MKKLIPVIIGCFAVVLVGVMASGNTTGCAGYPDVSASDSYCKSIEYVQSLEVMTGQGSGQFLPDTTLSRAEAAAVLVRYLDIEVPTTRANIGKFLDADANTWYSGYFDALIERGIFEGYPDGTLKPGNTLNKAEWLKLFYVTQGRSGSTVEKHVADVPVQADTDWYRKYLNDALQNDFIDLSASKFYPAAGQKRKLVADLIYRADSQGANFDGQEVDVNDKQAVYQSRFGATDAHLTKEASYDIEFGWNYPSATTFVWSGGSASGQFSKGDNVVKESQDLGKTVVGRIGVDGNVSDVAAFKEFVKEIVERYDGDGNADMSNLKLPIKYWQFDDNNMAAADYASVMKATYEAVKNADGGAKVVQGEILSLSDSSKNFWQSVYGQDGASYVDYVLVKAGTAADLSVADYRGFLNSNGVSKPVWVVGAVGGGSGTAQAQDLFKKVVKGFGAGADKVFYSHLDTAGVSADSSTALSILGDRKEAFFAFEALVTYLDLFSSVSVNGSDLYEFKNGSRSVFTLLGTGTPSGFPTGYVGVNYLGDELADDQFNTNNGPIAVWK